MSVSSITLCLLGAVANLTREPPSARAEFFMAGAGPATSVLIGITGFLLSSAIGTNVPDGSLLQAVRAIADYLGTINLYVAGFNLIPGFPLDGGRVLRSAIWGYGGDRIRATAIAARGGQIVPAVLFCSPLSFSSPLAPSTTCSALRWEELLTGSGSGSSLTSSSMRHPPACSRSESFPRWERFASASS